MPQMIVTLSLLTAFGVVHQADACEEVRTNATYLAGSCFDLAERDVTRDSFADDHEYVLATFRRCVTEDEREVLSAITDKGEVKIHENEVQIGGRLKLTLCESGTVVWYAFPGDDTVMAFAKTGNAEDVTSPGINAELPNDPQPSNVCRAFLDLDRE